MLTYAYIQKVALLDQEHQQVYPYRHARGIGGQLSMQIAVDSLQYNHRALPLSKRLENYQDTCSSSLAALTAGNTIEMLLSKTNLYICFQALGLYIVFWTIIAAWVTVHNYVSQECEPDACQLGTVAVALDSVENLASFFLGACALAAWPYSSPYVRWKVFVFWFGISTALFLIPAVGRCWAFNMCSDAEVYPPWFLIWVVAVYRQKYFITYLLVCKIYIFTYVYIYVYDKSGSSHGKEEVLHHFLSPQ